MQRITRLILSLFFIAAIVPVVAIGLLASGADASSSRSFARPGGIEQPPYSVGTRPLLVLAMHFAEGASEDTSRWIAPMDRDSISQRFFGSVNSYMKAASRGAFSYTPARETQGVADDGIVEVSSSDSIASYPSLPERAIAAIHAADDSVDFASFDTDGDGAIEDTELTIALVSIGGGPGAPSAAMSMRYTGMNVTVDGVEPANDLWTAEVTPYSNVMTMIHELFHATFETVDEYGWGVGDLSIMGPTVGLPDAARFLPSAVTRLQLGWSQPVITDEDGTFSVRSADTGDAVIISDGDASRYFIVEFRSQSGFDNGASGTGLVVWRVDNTVARVGSGMTRAVELITPTVLATDQRVAGCGGGETVACRSGNATDVFTPGRGDVVPLRNQRTGTSAYSAGDYTGIVISNITATASGATFTVTHNAPLPAIAKPPAVAPVRAGSTVLSDKFRPTNGIVHSESAMSADSGTSTTEVLPSSTTTPAPSAGEAESLLQMMCSPEVFAC